MVPVHSESIITLIYIDLKIFFEKIRFPWCLSGLLSPPLVIAVAQGPSRMPQARKSHGLAQT